MKHSGLIISSESIAAHEEGGDAGPETESRALTIPPAQHGLRLDLALVQLVPEFSRSYLQQLIDSGAVQLDGRTVCKPSARVKAGAVGSIELRPTPQSQAFKPQEMPLQIVFSDAHLMVINKPAGLVVHPAPGNWTGTLLNGLLAQDAQAAALPRAGIVHRLDKDTSGVMVVAKTEEALARLSAAFAARDLDRAYLALTWGTPAAMAGEVEGAIGRDPRDRKRMAVVTRGGKAALTRYRVLRSWAASASLLECVLATGRTHQIRVHLAGIGHPLVGDPVYLRRVPAAAKALAPPARGALLDFPRQALHAARLGFAHPRTGAALSFERPMPSDMAALVGALDG